MWCFTWRKKNPRPMFLRFLTQNVILRTLGFWTGSTTLFFLYHTLRITSFFLIFYNSDVPYIRIEKLTCSHLINIVLSTRVSAAYIKRVQHYSFLRPWVTLIFTLLPQHTFLNAREVLSHPPIILASSCGRPNKKKVFFFVSWKHAKVLLNCTFGQGFIKHTYLWPVI